MEVKVSSVFAPTEAMVCNMHLLSNYVPVLAKILQNPVCIYIYIVQEIRTAHKAYLETSVGVVGVVKKHRSHQKCCGGMGSAVVQQTCS